jgi:hypothetical protein
VGIDESGQSLLDALPADTIEPGGVVEVFRDDAEAVGRQGYLRSVGLTGVAHAHEYDYRSGTVLLRVSGALTPAQAGEYQQALTVAVH